MSEHPIFTTNFDLFVALAYTLTFSSLIWLTILFRTRRYLFVKPSMALLVWSHFLFQWPFAILSAYYENVLPDPYSFLLIVHGFVLIGLLVSQTTGEKSAQVIFTRARLDVASAGFLRPVVLLSIYCGIVVAIYLSVVPMTKTGLYVIIANPQLATLARDESLKQVTNHTVIYLYSTMASGVVPVLAGFLAVYIVNSIRARKPLPAILGVSVILTLLVGVSLTGARAAAVKLLVVLVVAILIRQGIPFRPLPFVLACALVLAPATILSLLREGQTISVGNFFEYLGRYIVSRAFVMPLHTGAFYVHYAQTQGFIGVAAIPRLATLLGVTPIDVPDTIGSIYAHSGVQSVRTSANGGFLFSYYSYFGLISLPICLGLLWLLDLSLVLYQRLSSQILLPTLAASAVCCLAFVTSDFTTVLVTHGFLVVLLVAKALQSLETSSNDGRQPSSALFAATST